MKRKSYILFLLASICLTSCDSWFEVSPEDQVSSDELYSTGSGYRMQLNGIYKTLSETSLYGKELSWGFIDILGQYYDPEYLDGDQTSINEFRYNDKSVKSIAGSIWSRMYYAVANCNDLIEHVSKEKAGLFENGEIEKSKIYGEALAMRAFIHFDLLRLFAPAPGADDGHKYIPYVTNSQSVINSPLTVSETLEKIVRDLQAAEPLLVQWDSAYCISEGEEQLRIRDVFYYPFDLERGGVNTNAISFFEKGPGFRMHFPAVKAMLARVYAYMGEKKLAYNEAKAVCDMRVYGAKVFDFTSEAGVEGVNESGDKKLLGDVILGFYNEYNVDNFVSCLTSKPLYLRNLEGMFDGDAKGSDVRYLYLTTNVNNKGRVSVKNRRGTSNVAVIPIIRKSELYYIMGEYLMEQGTLDEVQELIQEIKRRRNDISRFQVSDLESYMDIMLIDARREFIGEGQSFFMYKRLNRPLWDGASTFDLKGKNYLPIPDSEHVVI